MSTAAEIRAAARAQGRAQVRDAVLDAAYAATVSGGWGRVRMGALAAEVGISRQGLYNEFGSKADLGQALVLRDAEEFLRGVGALLDGGEDALASAATEALQRLSEHRLLQSIVTAPSDGALLPLLTSRSGPLVERATQVLVAWSRTHRPACDAQRAAEMADVLVRLVISYAVMPGDSPAAVGRRLAEVFEAGLR